MRSRTVFRVTTVLALLLAALAWGSGSQAAPGDDPTASLGVVSCVGGDGKLDITVTAGDSATAFLASLSNPYTEGLERDLDLDAGDSGTLSFDDLADEDYELDLSYYDEDFEDTLIQDTVTVACDPAPVGPYANAKGVIDGYCGDAIEVRAANKPIGGNTADLQPVTFTLTYYPSEIPVDGDEPVDGGDDGEDGEDGEEEPVDEEPVDEEPVEEEPEVERRAALEPVVLDTFTLDATTATYLKTFAPEDLGVDSFYGRFELTAADTVVAEAQAEYCVVSPASGEADGGAAVPSTGA